MTTADAAADYLVALAHERGVPVNNLKLQKLLYYAQAWHLALRGEPLFPERFQAWSTGPVVPSVFRRFEPFGCHDLPGTSQRPTLGEPAERLLDDVAREYLPLDEYELASLACGEAPWRNARGDLDVSEPCARELDEREMRAFFRQLARAA